MNEPQTSNWWGRNWKWLVPVGCLTTVVIMLGFGLAIVFFVFRMLQSSDVYQQALQKARQDPAVIAALGSPVESGYYMGGNIYESNGSGGARLTIPVSGPKASGTLYVEASETADVWTYSKLVVEIDATKQRIDLLAQPSR